MHVFCEENLRFTLMAVKRTDYFRDFAILAGLNYRFSIDFLHFMPLDNQIKLLFILLTTKLPWLRHNQRYKTTKRYPQTRIQKVLSNKNQPKTIIYPKRIAIIPLICYNPSHLVE